MGHENESGIARENTIVIPYLRSSPLAMYIFCMFYIVN